MGKQTTWTFFRKIKAKKLSLMDKWERILVKKFINEEDCSFSFGYWKVREKKHRWVYKSKLAHFHKTSPLNMSNPGQYPHTHAHTNRVNGKPQDL